MTASPQQPSTVDEIADKIYVEVKGSPNIVIGLSKNMKVELIAAINELRKAEIRRVLDRLKKPTMNDVFPSPPYDGSQTLKDMLQVVNYYEDAIKAEKERLNEPE